jgi:uncharacterized protein (AIM24 family)
MVDAISCRIFGDDLQLVEIEPDPGEGVQAEAGTMTYMEDGIEMQTSVGGRFPRRTETRGNRIKLFHHLIH